MKKVLFFTILVAFFSLPIFAKSLNDTDCAEFKGEWKVNKRGKGKCKLSSDAKKLVKMKKRCEKVKGSFDIESKTCENAQCKSGKSWDAEKGKCKRI